MPVQSAFTLLIIGGAFAVASGLIGSVHYMYTGKRRQSIGEDAWSYHMRQRDMIIKSMRDAKDKK
jgi:hypothetical protein